jgi:hypothetical protein
LGIIANQLDNIPFGNQLDKKTFGKQLKKIYSEKSIVGHHSVKTKTSQTSKRRPNSSAISGWDKMDKRDQWTGFLNSLRAPFLFSPEEKIGRL